MFAGTLAPATAEDAIAMMQAADAATRVDAAQVAVVDLNTLDDDLADPPLPPPADPPQASSPPVRKGEGRSPAETTTAAGS